jgi:hypothetical protein
VSVLAWLEQTGASVWIRESPSLLGFPFVLFLHTLGLAMLAGTSIGIDVWILRERAFVRPITMTGFFRVMWLGFGINAVSGIALLIAYPAKALTDPVFYVKLALVALAVFIVTRINRDAFPEGRAVGGARISPAAQRWAVTSLITWAATILAGRLLAYTYRVLLTTDLP